MKAVFGSIRDLLLDDGLFFIYQLTSKSAYQKLHSYYAEHTSGRPPESYMEFEDSVQIMEAIGWPYELRELRFPHRIPRRDEKGPNQGCWLR